MDFEALKAIEDEIARIVDALPKWKQAMLYRYLYALGFRISTVESEVEKGAKQSG